MTDLSGIPFEADAIRIRHGQTGRLILARLKPNQDLIEAVEQIATQYEIRHGMIRSAVGSIIDAHFVRTGTARAMTSETRVAGPGIEILEANGEISPNGAGAKQSPIVKIHAVVGDRDGAVFAGMLKRGENRTLITVELSIEEWYPQS